MKRGTSVFANPVLIGATATLVVIVAVALSYRANNGLPFVPYRQIKLDLPNGNELVKDNDVKEGGERVGFVPRWCRCVCPMGVWGRR